MLLSVKALKKSFETEEGVLPVLRGVDLDLAAGEKLALTGESGSGKSTLLYLVGGLDKPDSGSIVVNGSALHTMSDKDRAALRRDVVGMVFQQFNLIPSLTVADNLSFYARLADRVDPDWIASLTERLGLGDFKNRYPEQLSGGQQQRVAIGRTLAARPKLVLADEPTGNLDEETSDNVVDLMMELVDETGAGLLTVTHSQKLADRMDRQFHLRSGQIVA